jgi:choline dehydrogenase-like flavoprotein
MIIEAASVGNNAIVDAQVCIVGAGPAGIALALDLSEKGISVLLLESGWLKADPSTQALYEGSVTDERMHSPPDKYRHRRLGGSSAIWGGRCMPMDPIDFEQRSYLNHSGWPISYQDLLPFYPAANAFAEAGRFSYDSADALGPDIPPLITGFESADVSTTGLERFSCPTNFGARYYKRLALSTHIRVMLGANCVRIGLSTDGRQIKQLDIATLSGQRFFIKPQTTVLAMGGLETARLLLASNDVQPAGVGNSNDAVGRYYMCHIAGNVGALLVNGSTNNVRHGYEISPEGIYCRRRISVKPDTQRRLGLLNSVGRLHFPRITDPSHRNGVLSGLVLARRFISYEYGKRLHDGSGAQSQAYLKHVRNVVMDPLDTTRFLTHWLTRRTFAQRKYPSVILRNRTNRFSLELHGEQAPNPQSRVVLTDKADQLGMRQLEIDWRYCNQDIDSLKRTLELLSTELTRSKVAQLEFDQSTLAYDLTRYGAYGGHHIGTARMGADTRSSVVDAQCRVHSVANLFIAGSAVFPTSSQANPTLTLIALSLRLSRTLSKTLSTQTIRSSEEHAC